MQTSQEENENLFKDFIHKQTIPDPFNFTLSLDAFRLQHPHLAQELIRDPLKYYRLAKSNLEKIVHGDEKKRYDAKVDHYNISFEGNLGTNFVTPRGLGSKLANQLVGVQGIITKMEMPRYQLEKSLHWCEKTKSYEAKEYPDNYNPEKQFEAHKTTFIPTRDQAGNPLFFEQGGCSFRDIQNAVVQELPEMAPTGLLPQSVNVVFQKNLVNKVKPGDRVQMIGIYKLIGGHNSLEKGIFKSVFLCLSLKPLQQTIVSTKLISKLTCPENELYSLFSRSIAPSIYGHEYLKKAVLLMMLGGCELVLENGTHLRGDINVLLVGDPGTAKSQMLRWVLSTVDLGIGTTGSGASGVGLTAAIVFDKDTGERNLEAGAMVLADRGIVCIDQFDKMNEIDRVAVHEVMEQQTVTIAKAGMHCSLNARCSVFAAANPIYGEYQPELSPTKNIGMPDSLLSRFDLVFIIEDEKNAANDKRVAERVCRNHRCAPNESEKYNQFNEDDDFIIRPVENQKADENVYDKSNVFKSDSKTEILTQSFLKKYIAHCKANVAPVLSEDAVELISALWILLRSKDFNSKTTSHTKVLPITIRTHETLIRLSTAHAKLRQSSEVLIQDCVEAFRLVVYSLEKDEHALDRELQQILKELGLHFNVKSVHAPKEKNEPKSESVVTEHLTKKMDKMSLDRGSKEADAVLNRGGLDKKKKKALVFKALGDLSKREGKQKSFSLNDLVKRINGQMETAEIKEILEELDNEGKVHYDPVHDKILQ